MFKREGAKRRGTEQSNFPLAGHLRSPAACPARSDPKGNRRNIAPEIDRVERSEAWRRLLHSSGDARTQTAVEDQGAAETRRVAHFRLRTTEERRHFYDYRPRFAVESVGTGPT